MVNWMAIPNVVKKMINSTRCDKTFDDNSSYDGDTSESGSEKIPNNNGYYKNLRYLEPNGSSSEFIDETSEEDTSFSITGESDEYPSDSDEIFVNGKEIASKLYVVDKLGKGGFGVVYKVRRANDGEDEKFFAMKVSSKRNRLYDIEHEIFILNNMKDSPYFCKPYVFGKLYGRTILVMTMLGSTLNEIRKRQDNHSFDLYTTACLGMQCIEAIEHLHRKFFLHNDIKGHNFATGVGTNLKNIYLFDFGLSESLVIINRQKNEYAFKSEVRTKKFSGTHIYASPYHNHGYTRSFRDDLFSFFYMIVEFYKGTLPWRNVPSSLCGFFQIRFENKMLIQLPLEFLHIYKYIKGLKFDDMPDYEIIKKYLTMIVERCRRQGYDDPYSCFTIYEKYRKIPIEQLASDAVFEQAQQAKMQPRTGNKFIDMLHENGIPIGSSLKGIEQALRTQKEMENNDPTEQIAKAVFEKFQKQILPGLVANMIAGKNPFQMPGGGGPMPRTMAQGAMTMNPSDPPLGTELAKHFRESFQKNIERLQTNQFAMNPIIAERLDTNIRKSDKKYLSNENEDDYIDDSSEQPELSVPLSHNKPKIDDRYPEVENFDDVFKRRRRPREADLEASINQFIASDPKAALVLGLNDIDIDKNDGMLTDVRQSPIDLSTSMKKELEPMMTEEEISYALSDPEDLLAPIKPLMNPNPQAGYVTPRKNPKRPRKMLPLMIGVAKDDNIFDNMKKQPLPNIDDSYENDDEPTSTLTTTSEKRKSPIKIETSTDNKQHSRVLENLKNNPGLVALFEGTDLAEKLDKPSFMSDSQRGYTRGNAITTYPRMYSAKIYGEEPTIYDKKTKQIVEEREIPPLFFVPKGRHTRLRWTTATEQEIPGIGSRFIVPSLDPTRPAINSVMSTQGKERNEYETTWKIPNGWNSGDIFGISMNSKTEKLIGGDGIVDFPAMGRDVIFG
uniref:Protein kinase domain-containing protein n=1 Tax=Parastrongyloides trichosuri TaxID=131310 RepID=A0A0N4ZFN9_PARTI